jgi:hypothetical protein
MNKTIKWIIIIVVLLIVANAIRAKVTNTKFWSLG